MGDTKKQWDKCTAVFLRIRQGLLGIFSGDFREEIMKKRIIHAFALVCCGFLLYDFCAGSAVRETTKKSLTAGVTSQTVVDIAKSPEVSISKSDVVITALGQETTYGYTNIGVANCEGNLNVREEPSPDGKLVGKMPEHAGCEVLEYAGDWVKVSSGEVTGYVMGSYIMTGDEAAAMADSVAREMATVKPRSLNVRSEANTECSVLAQMPEGEQMEVVGLQGDWVQVVVDNDMGYVSAEYVDIAKVLPKAMTMTEVRFGSGVSDVRVDLVSYATQFIGHPYVWGGTSLTRGADCSGFTLAVYAKYGVSLPHSSKAQANCGRRISASEAKPGDLFFYGRSGTSGIGHVGIYIGNGQIVHASSQKTGIKISSAYYRSPICVVSLID